MSLIGLSSDLWVNHIGKDLSAHDLCQLQATCKTLQLQVNELWKHLLSSTTKQEAENYGATYKAAYFRALPKGTKKLEISYFFERKIAIILGDRFFFRNVARHPLTIGRTQLGHKNSSSITCFHLQRHEIYVVTFPVAFNREGFCFNEDLSCHTGWFVVPGKFDEMRRDHLYPYTKEKTLGFKVVRDWLQNLATQQHALLLYRAKQMTPFLAQRLIEQEGFDTTWAFQKKLQMCYDTESCNTKRELQEIFQSIDFFTSLLKDPVYRQESIQQTVKTLYDEIKEKFPNEGDSLTSTLHKLRSPQVDRITKLEKNPFYTYCRKVIPARVAEIEPYVYDHKCYGKKVAELNLQAEKIVHTNNEKLIAIKKKVHSQFFDNSTHTQRAIIDTAKEMLNLQLESMNNQQLAYAIYLYEWPIDEIETTRILLDSAF